MVDDELRDGSRIGALLSSEVHGHEQGALGRLAVVDADRDAAPSEEGTFAYAVEYRQAEADAAGGTGRPDDAGDGGGRVGTRVAEVYLHPDRVRVEFLAARETAMEAAREEGLRVGSGDDHRPDDHRPDDHVEEAVPVVVENGAAVKQALRVVRTVAEALDEELGES